MLAKLIAIPLLTQAVLVAELPRWDVTGSCRGATSLTQSEHNKTIAEKCMALERRTRDELEKKWSSFPAGDQSYCQESIKWFSPTYSELLSCLESRRDARRIQQNGPAETAPTRR